MAGGCCGGSQDNTEKLNDAAWRRVLWIALVINAVMFGVEIVAGVTLSLIHISEPTRPY